jgi:hypothetical protein
MDTSESKTGEQMSFDLLSEVKRLEKQVKQVLAGMAVAAKEKPLPPQASKLCGLSQTLAEVRTSIEGDDSSSSPPSKRSNEGDWGTAFKAPPAPPPVDNRPEDVAQAWIYPSNEAPACSPPAADVVKPAHEVPRPISPANTDNEESWDDLEGL